MDDLYDWSQLDVKANDSKQRLEVYEYTLIREVMQSFVTPICIECTNVQGEGVFLEKWAVEYQFEGL